MTERLSSAEIRQLVREVLREVLPLLRAGSPDAGLAAQVMRGVRGGETVVVPVRIADDADLEAFARTLAGCAAEGDLAAALAAGRVRFRLAGTVEASGGGAAKDPPAAGRRAEYRWEKGVLNESRIAEIGKTHGRIVLGPRAVLTPLARDKAREIKLELVRNRP